MHDAIVVGGRCGGAPTAMLLARAGHRVLLVDRAAFPSDTLSTHYLHPPSLARLERWGLREAATAGAPAWRGARLDLGAVVLDGAPPPCDGIGVSSAPRRTTLDAALVRGAVRAGAELRESFTVRELVFRDGGVAGVRGAGRGGAVVTERARVVVGADGAGSRVARAAGAACYVDLPPRTCAYYGYWDRAGVDRARMWLRPGITVIAFPTEDGLTAVYAAWPQARFREVRADPERALAGAVERAAPELADRLRAGRREGPVRGSGRLANRFRVPHGPGWALVGDAGHHEDPLLAHGIGNALRDAEMLAEAIDAGLTGRRPLDEALAAYRLRRDAAAMPLFQLGYALATLEPPAEPLGSYLAAAADDPAETGRFLGALAGTVPLADVLAPERVQAVVRRWATGPARAAGSCAREETPSLA